MSWASGSDVFRSVIGDLSRHKNGLDPIKRIMINNNLNLEKMKDDETKSSYRSSAR